MAFSGKMINSLFVSELKVVFALPSVASRLCQGFSRWGLGTPRGLFKVLPRSPTKRENLFTKISAWRTTMTGCRFYESHQMEVCVVIGVVLVWGSLMMKVCNSRRLYRQFFFLSTILFKVDLVESWWLKRITHLLNPKFFL